MHDLTLYSGPNGDRDDDDDEDVDRVDDGVENAVGVDRTDILDAPHNYYPNQDLVPVPPDTLTHAEAA